MTTTYVNPFTTAVSVVQRPIAGRYVVIQGFDQGARSYYPDLPPEVNTLKTMDGEHGYWIKTVSSQQSAVGSQQPAVSSQQSAVTADCLLHPADCLLLTGDRSTVATLRLVGEKFAEDRPIPLDAGWNLVSYLPRQALAVQDALQSIDGQYTAVLGFEGGALSYYPHLDPSFNTLRTMKPLLGYWIKMRQAGTLRYPSAVGSPPSAAPSADSGQRTADIIHQAERAMGVTPTHIWVNFYGTAHLLDGTPLPVGATVEALDPDGVACGVAAITTAGQYGLLACYGDDPTTAEDEGARPGDTIRLAVDGQVLGTAVWTAHGDLVQVHLGGAGVTRPWRVYLPLVRQGNR